MRRCWGVWGALYRKFETYIPRNETGQLRSQFYLHVSGSNLYIPTIGLIWNLYYCIGTAAKQRVAAFPFPPLRFCGWAESSHKWPTYNFPLSKITDHKWKKLILVVNFLFEWDSKYDLFLLNSHRPFSVTNAEIYKNYPRPSSLLCCTRNILTVLRETLTQYITFNRGGEGSLWLLNYCYIIQIIPLLCRQWLPLFRNCTVCIYRQPY